MSTSGILAVNPVILAVDPGRRNAAAAMLDCHLLGYLRRPLIDLTFGEGAFWNLAPGPEIAIPRDLRCDFRAVPLRDGSAGSVVFDPPYKLNGTSQGRGPAQLDARYGVSGAYRPVAEVRALITDGMREGWRLLPKGGFLIVKCAAQQSSGKLNHQPSWIVAMGEELRMRLVDELHIMSGVRRQPRTQRTARQNASSVVVLQK